MPATHKQFGPPLSVAIVTSIHPDFDARIWKHARLLADAGHRVRLVCPWEVAPGSVVDGVELHPFPKAPRRLLRPVWSLLKLMPVLRRLLRDTDIVHFHDLDLLPWMTPLALWKPVVFDVHENYPDEMLEKTWIPTLLRRPVFLAVKWVQWLASRVIRNIVLVADVPRTVGIIQPILLLLFVGASRALARVWLGDKYQSILKHASRPKVLIYGAGTTGRQLVAALANSHEMQVVGFLDDDDRLHGHVLNGQPIYNPADLVSLVSTVAISSVLLAMPRLNRARRNEILNHIRKAHVSVRTLPSMTDIAQGKVGISDLRELDIDDLLGREPVSPNHILLGKSILGKTVLVTGAGGSIGSELCRQISAVGPSKLLLIDHSEFALYSIHQELAERVIDRKIALGSVHSSRFVVISCLLDRAHGTANVERRAMVTHRKSAARQANR